MDPKMDSGMILDSDLTKKPFILDARLGPREVLGIIDQLFICEVNEDREYLGNNVMLNHF